MTKRIAAAVLSAIVNFVSAQDAAAVDPDAGEDGEVNYVELRRDRNVSPALAAASRACGGEIDCAWVLRHHSGPGAAVAVQRDDLHHTALVSVAADVSVLPWQPLLGRSLAMCRECDVLKVVVEAEGVSVVELRALVEADGFQFAGQRHEGGIDVAEFYTDLYRRDVTRGG